MSSLLIAAALGSAVIGGVFFAFSSFVMRALAQLPPAHGAAAMQRINVVVLNPLFLGVFMGTAVLHAAVVVLPLPAWAPWPLAGAVLYLVGTFGVTIAGNVPRNDRLKALSADSAEGAAYWTRYLREWTALNHLRTAAAMAAALCDMVALTGA